MTYHLKDEAKDFEGIAGVPWRDMSDNEFKEVSARYDEQHPSAPGSLERWFTHTIPAPTPRKKGDD